MRSERPHPGPRKPRQRPRRQKPRGSSLSYETTSYGDIFKLTRLHRDFIQTGPRRYAEETGNSIEARAAAFEPVRYSGAGSEYVAPSISFPKAVIGRPSKTKYLRAQLWRQGRRTCCFCDRHLRLAPFWPNTLTLEHLTPLSRGGSNHMDNLDAACSPCNNRKGSLTEAEFRAILDLERAPFR